MKNATRTVWFENLTSGQLGIDYDNIEFMHREHSIIEIKTFDGKIYEVKDTNDNRLAYLSRGGSLIPRWIKGPVVPRWINDPEVERNRGI